MNNNQQSKETTADVMVNELQKISDALETLMKKGMPESIIMAYIQKKTKLPQRDIQLVFDALRSLNREFKKKE